MTRKRWTCIAVSVVMLLAGVLAQKANAQEVGSWTPVVSFDYLGVGNLKNQVQSAANAIQNACPTCTDSVNAYGAYGGRVEMFYHLSDNFDIGPSLGYLSGGPDSGNGKIKVADGSAGALSAAATDNTFRALLEGKKKFPINQDWSFYAEGGLGMALDNDSATCSDSGSLAGDCAGISGTSNWGYFTWELSPSLLYKSVEFGLRYVGFARGGFVPWNTEGAFLGYHF